MVASTDEDEGKTNSYFSKGNLHHVGNCLSSEIQEEKTTGKDLSQPCLLFQSLQHAPMEQELSTDGLFSTSKEGPRMVKFSMTENED